MLDYIIKVLLFQTLFLAIYDILLKKETFFQWNRAYLIFTSIVAYAIPLIKIDSVQKILPQELVVHLPEVLLSPSAVIKQQFDWSALFFTGLQAVFLIGIIITSLLFFIKLYKIIRLIAINDKEFTSNYYLVWMKNNTAFSFFNYIFLGKENTNKTEVIEHELVHVQQKHSLDLLFFEVQKIVCWFNPFSYLYQYRISELHEFIADSKVVKEKDKASYFNELLAETFGVTHISFINPFLKHSLIKKRIMMLNKNKSKKLQKLKYLLLIPIFTGMLLYTSCEKTESEFKEDDQVTELEESKLKSGKELTEKELTEILNLLGNKLNENETKELEKLFVRLIEVRKNMKISKEKSFSEIMEVMKTMKKNSIDSDAIPFSVLEQSPIFPGCEDAEDAKDCFTKSIQQHVAKNFNTDLTKILGLGAGKKRVLVLFKIDKNGNITELRARGPHIVLEREAIRVVKSLPKMQAGEQAGKKVAVEYVLPITLQIE